MPIWAEEFDNFAVWSHITLTVGSELKLSYTYIWLLFHQTYHIRKSDCYFSLESRQIITWTVECQAVELRLIMIVWGVAAIQDPMMLTMMTAHQQPLLQAHTALPHLMVSVTTIHFPSHVYGLQNWLPSQWYFVMWADFLSALGNGITFQISKEEHNLWNTALQIYHNKSTLQYFKLRNLSNDLMEPFCA
mgnify:CR=1 FL=1